MLRSVDIILFPSELRHFQLLLWSSLLKHVQININLLFDFLGLLDISYVVWVILQHLQPLLLQKLFLLGSEFVVSLDIDLVQLHDFLSLFLCRDFDLSF